MTHAVTRQGDCPNALFIQSYCMRQVAFVDYIQRSKAPVNEPSCGFVQFDLTAWAKPSTTRKDRRVATLRLQGRRDMRNVGRGLLNNLGGEGEEDKEIDEERLANL